MAASGRAVARTLRPVLAAALLGLPLLSGLSTEAAAQVECSSANTDGSYNVPSSWALKPSGLNDGDTFRLLFITSTVRNAQSTSIADYNTHVQTAAKAGHTAISDSCGNRFKVVGSTSSVDARANTDTESTDTAATIYWLDGNKLADDYADFYDGDWDDYGLKNESGSTITLSHGVWTGSNQNGTKHASRLLGGSPVVNAGRPVTSSNPIDDSSYIAINAFLLPFYALSPVFKVVPLPVIELSSATYRVGEGDGTARITVKKTGSGAATVQYLTTPLTAAGAGVDFTQTQGTLTFASSDRSKTVSVPITDDTSVESDETFAFDLTNPSGATLGTATATVTIRDNDGAVVAPCSNCVWMTGGSAITEGGTAMFVLHANPAPSRNLRVGVSVHDAPGTYDPHLHRQSANFLRSSEKVMRDVMIPSGQTAVSIRVPTVDDGTDEPDGHVSAVARGMYTSNGQPDWGTGYRAHTDPNGPFGLAEAEVSVRDNDDPPVLRRTDNVSLALSRYSIEEDDADPWVDIIASLSRAQPARFSYTVCITSRGARRSRSAGQTGANGYDYRIWQDGYIPTAGCVSGSFAPGATTDSPIRIEVLDDSHEDSGETIRIGLLRSHSERWEDLDVGLEGPLFRTLVINNDEGRTDTHPADHPLTRYRTVVKSFHDRITARHGHGDSASGGWNKRFLKAMGHPDYVDYPQAAVTVADATRIWNQGGNAAWDGTVEAVTYAEKYFAGQVTTPTPDPAPTPEVTIAAGADITEGGDATFTFSADPAPAAALDVSVTVTAEGEFGITAGTQTVTIPTTGSATLTLATAGDDADEADGSVSVTVDAGTGYTVGSDSTGTVAIADDDDPAPQVGELPAGHPVMKYASLVKSFHDRITARHQHGDSASGGWNKRFLKAMGHPDYVDYPQAAVTVADATRLWNHGGPGANTAWDGTVEAVTYAEQWFAAQATTPEPESEQQPANAAPAVANAIPDQAATAGTAFAYQVAANAFTDADGDSLTYSAMRADGSALPSWLAFASGTRTFSGTPSAADADTLTVRVTAEDGNGGTAFDDFVIAVSAPTPVPVPVPAVSVAADAASVTEGTAASFTFTASPSPSAALDVTVAIAATGDYGIAAGTRTVTIPTTGSTTLTLATDNDGADEPDGSVTATVNAGTGYTVGTASSGTVTVKDNDVPEIAIAAGADVTEGGEASFTLTADPVPHAPLSVKVAIAADGAFGVTAGERSVTMPVSGTATLKVATTGDDADEPDGSVTATLKAGTGYSVGSPSSGTVAVRDDDEPAVAEGPSVLTLVTRDVNGDGPGHVTEGGTAEVEVRLNPAPAKHVTLYHGTLTGTAHSNRDYRSIRPTRMDFRAGEAMKVIRVRTLNDSHDEGLEQFGVRVWPATDDVTPWTGVIATVEITNDDPMPAAYLARFGRTVAQQALDGIAERLSAPRAPGAEVALAGHAVGEAAPEGDAETGIDARTALAVEAMEELARTLAAEGGTEPDGGSVTPQDALLATKFALTAEPDGAGGSLAFWGRASQGSFAGREGTFSLDGEAVTTMLGADHARGRWLLGLALLQTTAEGDYRDTGTGSVACPDGVACDGAVREGDGTMEASLGALVPYASLRVSDRMRLWAALGSGSGDLTLGTAMGGTYETDLGWRMAAVGARGELVRPPADGSGLALAAVTDALWTRTASDAVDGLAASESDVTRFRVGLEGSWRVALEGGGTVTPRIGLGARHDGGDAETGAGIELGGGVSWTDPGLGVTLDVSGRTLIAHGADGLEDRGLSVSFTYDPDPSSARGPTISMRQDLGGSATGGVDALFAPDPLADRAGSDAATRRTLEAAWGFPVFGGRFTGAPHAGVSDGDGSRDWALGWRLTPEAEGAPDVSFSTRGTRTDDGTGDPVHGVGIEAAIRW